MFCNLRDNSSLSFHCCCQVLQYYSNLRTIMVGEGPSHPQVQPQPTMPAAHVPQCCIHTALGHPRAGDSPPPRQPGAEYSLYWCLVG